MEAEISLIAKGMPCAKGMDCFNSFETALARAEDSEPCPADISVFRRKLPGISAFTTVKFQISSTRQDFVPNIVQQR